ncbi:CAP domain-containing protein [Myxococcota bacterium]
MGGSTSNLSGDAAEYVDAHNAVRAAVEQPSNYPGAWEPLPPVTWSEELAASAQAWAQQLSGSCQLQHASAGDFGENIAGGSNLSPAGAVEMWASEEAGYSFNPSYRFVAGHYTQIVWRDSTTIGCGEAECSNGRMVIIVCRYSPPGNMIGAQPY